MAVTVVSQSNTFDQWRVKTNTIGEDLGDIATLDTVATNAVEGINEVNTNLGLPADLETTTQVNVVSAVNELNTNIGLPTDLTTATQVNVVSAVNELDTNIGDLSALNTTNQTDLVSAVNETKNFSLAISIALG